MADSFKLSQKVTNLVVKVPQKTQDVIPVERISQDGIFEVKKGLYDRLYRFEDINYELRDDEERDFVLNKYCQILNTLNIKFKIIVANKNKDMNKFEDECFYQMKHDEKDKYRQSYNELISDKMYNSRQGIEQERYLNISTQAKSYEDAARYFNNTENTLKQLFGSIESRLVPMDANERLQDLHDIYNVGNEDDFHFDFDTAVKHGSDWKNEICPNYFHAKFSYMENNDKVFRVLYVRSWPDDLDDSFLIDLMSDNFIYRATIDVTPLDKNVLSKKLTAQYMNVGKTINNAQQLNNKLGNFNNETSIFNQSDKDDIEELMTDMKDSNRKYFWTSLLIFIAADNLDELEDYTARLKDKCNGVGISMDVLHRQQYEAFLTSLPIANTYVKTATVLDTDSVSALVPFHCANVFDNGGIYYGINQIDKNVININRRLQPAGHAQVFGKTGQGKSMDIKSELTQVIIGSDDDVIIIDPLGEYADFVKDLGGDTLSISPASGTYINPFDVPKDMDNPDIFVPEKTELIVSMIEQAFDGKMELAHKSVSERCVRELYANLKLMTKAELQGYESPTFSDFYKIIKEQPEQAARDLELGLEMFVDGSLNIFAHKTNVDFESRILCIGLNELGEQLYGIAMLVILEKIKQRLKRNSEKGIMTWLYVDEEHILLREELSAKYMEVFYKMGRHWKTKVTGITQNVVDCIKNTTSLNIISNCDFIMLLLQSPKDREKIGEVFEIEDSALYYVTNADKGTGLIKYGKKLIPFDNIIDRKYYLYEAFNSDGKEREEEQENKEEEQQEQS